MFLFFFIISQSTSLGQDAFNITDIGFILEATTSVQEVKTLTEANSGKSTDILNKITINKGEVAGFIAEKGNFQQVISFSTGEIGWFERHLFVRSDNWMSGEGVSLPIIAGECTQKNDVVAPVLAMNGNGGVWVWIDGKPCKTLVKEKKYLSKPKEQKPKRMVRFGESVELNCPDYFINNVSSTKNQSVVGKVKILGRHPDGIQILFNGSSGVVPTNCDKKQDLVVANLNRKIELPSFSKQPIIIHFWATWCKPCIEELPAYQKFVDRLGSHRTLAISEDFIWQQAHRYLAEHKLTFPVAMDTKNGDFLASITKDSTLPLTVILYPNGEKKLIRGKIDWEQNVDLNRLIIPH